MRKRDKSKYQEEPQRSKKNSKKKKNKVEMSKCAYVIKGYHPERSCMKKKIDRVDPTPGAE